MFLRTWSRCVRWRRRETTPCGLRASLSLIFLVDRVEPNPMEFRVTERILPLGGKGRGRRRVGFVFTKEPTTPAPNEVARIHYSSGRAVAYRRGVRPSAGWNERRLPRGKAAEKTRAHLIENGVVGKTTLRKHTASGAILRIAAVSLGCCCPTPATRYIFLSGAGGRRWPR